MKSLLIDAIVNNSDLVFGDSVGIQQLPLDFFGYSEDAFVMTRLKLSPFSCQIRRRIPPSSPNFRKNTRWEPPPLRRTSCEIIRPKLTTISQRNRRIIFGASLAKLHNRALRPSGMVGMECTWVPDGGSIANSLQNRCTSWPRSLSPIAVLYKSSSVPPL